MPQDQIVNGVAEACKELVTPDVHRAKDRAILSRASNVVLDRNIDRELAHPAGLR